jgi:thioredoxin reductase (NADPH)
MDLDGSGYINVDARMQTSAPGIFAGGDCTGKLLRQVVTACGDGATAAFSAQLYVEALKGESY